MHTQEPEQNPDIAKQLADALSKKQAEQERRRRGGDVFKKPVIPDQPLNPPSPDSPPADKPKN